jgi:hypothetical protein
VLVVLDGHSSRKTLEAVELARENNITLLTLPPHTSHRLQPLDVTFFGPLKKAYSKEVGKWMMNNPGKRVTDYDICEIFTPAYNRVASIEKAVSGFKATGIYPFNADIFTAEDYAPSIVTDQEPVGQSVPDSTVTQTTSRGRDRMPMSSTMSTPSNAASSHSDHVPVVEISPYPHVQPTTTGRKRKAESSVVLTSTSGVARISSQGGTLPSLPPPLSTSPSH